MAENEHFITLERVRIEHFLSLASLDSRQANLSSRAVSVYSRLAQVLSRLRNVFGMSTNATNESAGLDG